MATRFLLLGFQIWHDVTLLIYYIFDQDELQDGICVGCNTNIEYDVFLATEHINKSAAPKLEDDEGL